MCLIKPGNCFLMAAVRHKCKLISALYQDDNYGKGAILSSKFYFRWKIRERYANVVFYRACSYVIVCLSMLHIGSVWMMDGCSDKLLCRWRNPWSDRKVIPVWIHGESQLNVHLVQVRAMPHWGWLTTYRWG